MSTPVKEAISAANPPEDRKAYVMTQMPGVGGFLVRGEVVVVEYHTPKMPIELANWANALVDELPGVIRLITDNIPPVSVMASQYLGEKVRRESGLARTSGRVPVFVYRGECIHAQQQADVVFRAEYVKNDLMMRCEKLRRPQTPPKQIILL